MNFSEALHHKGRFMQRFLCVCVLCFYGFMHAFKLVILMWATVSACHSFIQICLLVCMTHRNKL